MRRPLPSVQAVDALQVQEHAERVRWGYLVCLFAFHKWVRRRTDDDGGDVHVCVRCGKVNDGPDVDPRFQGM